ncbi:MAG TPA: NADH-quinone oxidoreductase subunit J [Pseudomonadales bacterium]|nr:NADH-quinone oxidoreductase subunit J [Pseudomonadales bacterium]
METVLFYLAALCALVATTLVVTRLNASHALVYLIVSLLAVAVQFFLLGAPFAAALEVVIYAGAIMVLFVFVVMMLNLGRRTVAREREWLQPRMWFGPGLITAVLLGEMLWMLLATPASTSGRPIAPAEVGRALYGPYLLTVELASVLLLAGLVGAYHLGRRYMRARREERGT